MFVAKIMDAPTPCIARNTRSTHMLRDITAAADAAAKIRIPVLNICFLSNASAILPKVTARQQQVSIYTVITHPISCALTRNSFPIEGIERFSALPMNVVMNAVITATSIVFFCSCVCILSSRNFFFILFRML